jgi:hypothetical protein
LVEFLAFVLFLIMASNPSAFMVVSWVSNHSYILLIGIVINVFILIGAVVYAKRLH